MMRPVLMLAAVITFASAGAWGITVAITVPNGSFENPDVNTSQFPNYTGATGEYWYRVVNNTSLGAGFAGPRQLPVGGAPLVVGVHDQAAGVGRNSSLFHTGISLSSLPLGYLTEGTYTVTYDLGIRSDQTTPRPSGYEIQVWGWDGSTTVGISPLGSYSFTFPDAYDWTGRWINDLSFSFVASTNPTITQLQIRLINLTVGSGAAGQTIVGNQAAQILFDRIRVTGDVVPEPSTYALMGTAGLALYLLRRRKASANR